MKSVIMLHQSLKAKLANGFTAKIFVVCIFTKPVGRGVNLYTSLDDTINCLNRPVLLRLVQAGDSKEHCRQVLSFGGQ